MDISNLDKAEVLAALYNAAQPQGLGYLHFTPEDMTVKQARELLDGGTTSFDYYNGRVMKINLRNDDLFTDLFDRDNGQGAAARALEPLIAKAA